MAEPEPAPPGPIGVVLDVDGILPLGTAVREFGRVRNLLGRTAGDRRMVMGMAGLVRALVQDRPGSEIYYLTGLPKGFAAPVKAMLRRDGFPPGTALMAPVLRPWALFGRRWVHKRATLDRLLAWRPELQFVLLGDDGEEDPSLFIELAGQDSQRVAAIGLRRVVKPDRLLPEHVGAVPVAAAPNAEELAPKLWSCVGTGPPRFRGPESWLLSADQRGNTATRIRAWTEGNLARPLVDGTTYFSAATAALAAAGPGTTVRFSAWRADAGERLAAGTDAPTIAGALRDAARRGASVRGLLWASYPDLVGCFRSVQQRLAHEVGEGGGRVLLDAGSHPLGCHHQKFLAVRHTDRPVEDVAFLGGIDFATGRNDDSRHRGDPQASPSSKRYGPRPPWHDVQVELRGPAAREVADTFDERWERRTAPLYRRRWAGRRPATTADQVDPPRCGTCAVQILRTYPARPHLAFAPSGERTIARAYAKALTRAERLVYIEDQYLWAYDVAVMIAAALHRAPRLQVVVVVPRFPDNEQPLYLDAARLGHGEALAMVQEAGGERVQILDIENEAGVPIYVHAKVCVIDDVWTCIGSANLNLRSWTHDSELCAAVLDEERDPREPTDPSGLGDGARRFARDLRLRLMTEHLGIPGDATDALVDPDGAAEAVRSSVAALDAWYDGGRVGPRPAGRLRTQRPAETAARVADTHPWLTQPAYRRFLDPDGRPLRMRMQRTY
ncbi:MAG: phosphatase domain-containing protein [Pseudonocardia sp.]